MYEIVHALLVAVPGCCYTLGREGDMMTRGVQKNGVPYVACGHPIMHAASGEGLMDLVSLVVLAAYLVFGHPTVLLCGVCWYSTFVGKGVHSLV